MGSGESRLYKPPTLKKESWREGKRGRQVGKPEHGRYRVLVNNLTNEQLEEYLLSFHSLAQFQRYLEFFQWREREDSIVNSKYLNYQLGRDFCNTSYTARVYLQRIPVRLSDIEDIPFPQNLYLLLTAFDGFEKLYRSVGYFRPTQDLICMDRDGRVKAWLHSDLSRCIPAGCAPQEVGTRRDEKLQTRMVEEILRLVQENTAREGEQGVTVSEYMRRNQRGRGLTFKQAKLEVISYAEEFNADIPNYFESVVGIFDDEASENDEQSAQHPSFLKNDEEREERVGQGQRQVDGQRQRERQGSGYHHEVVDSWQSYHPHQQYAQQKVTQQGYDYRRDEERVNSPPPMPQQEYRPASAVHSLNHPIEHLHSAVHQPPAYPLEYRSAPSQGSSASSPNFRVKFNYQPQVYTQQQPLAFSQSPPYSQVYPPQQPQQELQPLPPPPQFLPSRPLVQPNHLTPISQLTTPSSLLIKKVTSVPDETDRSRQQQRFDAKMLLSSSLKNLLSNNNRLVYSDSTSTYELDEELAEDMVKYLTANE